MATRRGYNKITISERLRMSAGFVDKGAVVADIGCDHAFTDIWLIKNEICGRSIAMDLREGPLAHAKENIGLYGVADRVETRLSYGLDALMPGEADTLLITGMGGTLMCDILERGREAAISAKTLILQPQSDVAGLRAKVYELGFKIVDEDMCREDGKFYVSIKAVKSDSDEAAAELSKAELEYGPIMIRKRSGVFLKYLDYQENKIRRMKTQIETSGSQNSTERLSEIMNMMELLNEARESAMT